MAIEFGTDGWRAVISEDFTFANVRQVAQAVAEWVQEEGEQVGNAEPTMVVGFDTRFLSDRYAIEVARVLAGNGIRVYLTKADAPTPVVSFAIPHLGAMGGVMITASHNPPRYNGIKLKVASGGSASSAHCRRIEEHLQRQRPVREVDFADAVRRGVIERFDPTPAYSMHLETLVRRGIISSRPGRVVVDAMYGAGRDYIRNWLSGTGWNVKQIRGELNPGFGGIHPEPIMPHLEALRKAVIRGCYGIGLATDGDADRTGAMDGLGRFVDPHSIFVLVLRYLVERRGLRGTVVKSVSMTRMVDRLCEHYGLPLRETPVGFGYISDLMMSEDVLIGGEESGGISIKGHIPQGDGILLGLLLLEIVTEAGASLAELQDELQSSFGPTHYARRDMKLARPVNKKEMTARLAGDAPGQIAGVSVQRVQSNDGVKYVMSNGGWLLIRPSGTEAVLRVYAESPEIRQTEALLAYGQSIAWAA
jgi:phosphomannomutase